MVAREDARHAGALARSLDAARADLERQAKSLSEAQRRAEGAARVKDEFLAMLGHELRNPLGPITTALQIMRLKGSASREQDILDRQVGNLMRLVDDLLDVSRIASGKVELRRERVELAKVAARAVELASPLLERKHQLLSVQIPERGILIDGDPDRLAQIFSNLLTNAAKYSNANTRIVFSAERNADTAIASVKDEGSGIAPEMLETIFDQFTQQQQSMERSLGGLGLGLAIVKNLVSLHGGSVRAISDGIGKGSEFIVELPISCTSDSTASAAALVSKGPVVERPVGAFRRILVVDDNEDASELLAAALLALGYVVRTASDGPSALLVANEFRPQIALLDIGLPVMDGYELGRRLLDTYGVDALHLVALTGYGQASDKARSREAGFVAHLVKPLALGDLHLLLERLSPVAAIA
jgi:CheY-like chemotaxis protein